MWKEYALENIAKGVAPTFILIGVVDVYLSLDQLRMF
jgi:hypothetical protein